MTDHQDAETAHTPGVALAATQPLWGALRVVIVAQNASTQFGGESILPWHYFRLLRKRGVDARLVVHERTRGELLALLPEQAERMHFVPDLPSQRLLWRVGKHLPGRVEQNTLGLWLHATTALRQRKVVRELIARHGVDVVHEPIPVSPKQPSFMFGLGVPLVIGPMNGGMNFPPAFAGSASLPERVLVRVGRELAHAANLLIPGKREAALLLTANERTRKALPRAVASPVIQLAENGVDLNLFGKRARHTRLGGLCRFVFMGRLVDWKRVDLLLEACALLRGHDFSLDVLGDGPMRAALEAQTEALELRGRVTFHGMLPQARCSELLAESDALVLPSLRECGGAVVLEAMACGLPVVATNWGGPADYLDARIGLLVEPRSPSEFVADFAQAMRRLIEAPELCRQLGEAARARVEREFDWERKIDRILEIYTRAAARRRPHTEHVGCLAHGEPRPRRTACEAPKAFWRGLGKGRLHERVGAVGSLS